MRYYQIPLGPLQTNCYVLSNDQKEVLIFDPGGEGRKLIEFVKEKQYTPVAILLTHAHFDHIGAVDEIRDYFNIPVYVHENEQEWLSNPGLNGSQFFRMGAVSVNPATHTISEEGKLTVGSFECEVYETPGHSPGSISYYFKEQNVVFSGDALFSGSIGRTDLPGGDHAQLLRSIHDKILQLPETTIVLSGHGPETTIGTEMDSNPFLNGF